MKRRKKNLAQSMTEYIIIVVLVAIASIAIVTIFGNQIRNMFFASSSNLAGNNETNEEVTGGDAARHSVCGIQRDR